MIDLDLWRAKKKELHLNYEMIAKQAQISKRSVEDIFRGHTPTPRIDTVQAIEKVLGLTNNTSISNKALPAAFENMPELLSEQRFIDIVKIYHELTDEYREKVRTVVTVIVLSVGLDIEHILETKK